MNLKDIIANNFTFPLVGGEYLKTLPNGTIDVNVADTYGTTYTDSRVVGLQYLDDLIDATRINVKIGDIVTAGTILNCNYESGDFLKQGTGNSAYGNVVNRKIVITNLPVGKGMIVRVAFSTAAAGSTITFGKNNDILFTTGAESAIYYIGFYRWSSAAPTANIIPIECVGIQKVLARGYDNDVTP